MICPQHPQRRRKGCEICYAPIPQSEGTIGRKPYPHVTEDGKTWLDPDGNPPKVNDKDELTEAFVLELKYGRERWGVGLVLPMTPAVYDAWAAELSAQHEQEAARRAKREGRR